MDTQAFRMLDVEKKVSNNVVTSTRFPIKIAQLT